MPALVQYFRLLRHLGPRWLGFRLLHAWRLRSGALRHATPAVPWSEVPAPGLFLADTQLRSGYDVQDWGAGAVADGTDILEGRFRVFSLPPVNLGHPPRWWDNPLGAAGAGIDRHWTASGDAAGGDIKCLWELSRFAWAFTLARAHAKTRDPAFSGCFWGLFEDWCAANRPNWGPQWMCGQEAAFRLMAVVFAAEATGVPQAQRPGLSRFVVATGRRIAANLSYALSQKNNHGISECVGLITAALVLPDFSASKTWLERGLCELRAQLEELVYADGSFAQHSIVYQRVVLHDLVWCVHRLRVARQTVPEWMVAAGVRTLDFLLKVTDPRTGRAPLFGSNDGANVLPLADGEFPDFRPVVQMAAAVFHRELPLPAGPWDEAAWWLVESWEELRRTDWPQTPACIHATEGGYLQLSSAGNRLFLRCPTRFRHRPGQADMLHVDVWHRGEAVAKDGGTFSYNSSERFTALASAAHHNVLTVDGAEPMQKFSRFLYLPWPAGTAKEIDGGWAATHDGYASLGIVWTRWVGLRLGGGFIVRDNIHGCAGRLLRWHWRLADRPWRLGEGGVTDCENDGVSLQWHLPPSATLRMVRADAVTAYGWSSSHYASVEPACALLIETQAHADVEVVFEFRLPS